MKAPLARPHATSFAAARGGGLGQQSVEPCLGVSSLNSAAGRPASPNDAPPAAAFFRGGAAGARS